MFIHIYSGHTNMASGLPFRAVPESAFPDLHMHSIKFFRNFMSQFLNKTIAKIFYINLQLYKI